MTDKQSVSDRACEHLDRISGSDPSRVIIMDLLDEISRLTGQVEHVAKNEREACASIVFGLCLSDNNAQEIADAIRARGES